MGHFTVFWGMFGYAGVYWVLSGLGYIGVCLGMFGSVEAFLDRLCYGWVCCGTLGYFGVCWDILGYVWEC